MTTTDPALSGNMLDAFLTTLVSLLQDIIQLMRDIILFQYNGVTLSFFDFIFALLVIDAIFIFYFFLRN